MAQVIKGNRDEIVNDAKALILRYVPDAQGDRLNLSAHQIANQVEYAAMGGIESNLSKWRGAFNISEGG